MHKLLYFSLAPLLLILQLASSFSLFRRQSTVDLQVDYFGTGVQQADGKNSKKFQFDIRDYGSSNLVGKCLFPVVAEDAKSSPVPLKKDQPCLTKSYQYRVEEWKDVQNVTLIILHT